MADKNIEMAEKIAAEVSEYGGRVFYVGGLVRDRLRGKSSKDVDIEVHGVSPAVLREILETLGEVTEMGESFGIFGLKNFDIDIAMPRMEEKRGSGHRDFDVFVDPFIGTLKAARRRDFTINALMEDVLTGEIVDHFGGAEDLKNRVIRHVNSDTFIEDPLRVLRAAQFAARFEFSIAEETAGLCRTISLDSLSKERVFDEMKKALLKARKPSIFFETLREMKQLETWFSEVSELIGISQRKEYHKEGDVWNHTMMVIDQAALFRDEAEEQTGFMISAITHDFGKTVTTELVNGEYHSHRHDEEGLPLAENFMKRITNERKLIEYVLNMTRYHMQPNNMFEDRSSIKATNRMFDRAICPNDLILLALSDGRGKIPAETEPERREFMEERLAVYREYMSRPYVMGRDLVEVGIEPDGRFSEYLEYAHKMRLAGVGKEDALKQTLAYIRKN